jgi:hypothetical protein
MTNFKQRLCALSAAFILGLTFSGCGKSSGKGTNADVDFNVDYITSSEKVESAASSFVTIKEANTKVPLSSTRITGKITIEQAGNYYVNSTIEGKKITVACEGVTLYLVNATLSNEKKVIESEYDLTITLIGENSISNSNSSGSNAIDCAGNLVINGGGSLAISSTKNGIKANSITVCKTTLVIDAKKDGLHAEVESYDSLEEEPVPAYTDGGGVLIYDSALTINSNDDGIQADTYVFVTGDSVLNITSQSKGIKAGAIDWGTDEIDLDWDGYVVYINSGDITINSADDSVHSNGDVVIDGGTFKLVSGDDGVHSDNSLEVNGGNIAIDECYEGLEGSTVDITGGIISIVASDDGINAAGGNSGFDMGDMMDGFDEFDGEMPDMTDGEMPDMSNGQPDMGNGQMPDFSNGQPNFGDGQTDMNGGQTPNMGNQNGQDTGGQMPSDTGNGGQMQGGNNSDMQMPDMSNDQMPDIGDAQMPDMGDAQMPDMGGGFGQMMGDNSYYINISGGVIYIEAEGDGIDSNGALYISGGELYVSGPLSADDSAIDFDGTAEITGGIVIAAGSSGMAENFTSSTQGSILMNFSSYMQGEIKLLDSSGSVLLSYTPTKKYNCVVISCPKLLEGQSYTLVTGNTSNTITLDTLLYSNGGFGMGMQPGESGGESGGGESGGGMQNGMPSGGFGGFDGMQGGQNGPG